MRKRLFVVLIIPALIFMAAANFAAESAYSQCGCTCDPWGEWIMGNTTISGLINPGEAQSVRFLSRGAWKNGIPVCIYTVWRIHSKGQDMQAYIELAKLGDTLYRMEIYHSWNTLAVDMPYDHTVLLQEQFTLVLRIEADV